MGKRIELDLIFKPTKARVAQRTEQQVPDLKAASSTPAASTKFDKTAYQREYMKRYRARKAKK